MSGVAGGSVEVVGVRWGVWGGSWWVCEWLSVVEVGVVVGGEDL